MVDKRCKDLVEEVFKNRMYEIREMYNSPDQNHPEFGRLNEFGLCLDFVEAGTFSDQREDFIRYQLSWGGPQEEFRLYKNGDVEFWYLDWFDGACVSVNGGDADIIKDICYGVICKHGWYR